MSTTFVPITSIHPTPENWRIYNKPEADDQFPALVASVEAHGVLEPITVSEDNFILSGHRRHAAAEAAFLEFVPVIVAEGVEIGPMTPEERIEEIIKHNHGSRVKSAGEAIAEAMASIDPERALREAKERKAQVFTMAQTSSDLVEVTTKGNRRTDPRPQRGDLLVAVTEILNDLHQRNMLPHSERYVNYRLLRMAPLTSKGIKGHPYGTDPKGDSSKLSKLLTDARSKGIIPHSWISDETRGGYEVRHSGTVGNYVASEVDDMFGNYFHNVHKDQPAHVEMIVEKNTMFDLIRKHVASKLRIPLTSCRGYSSFPVSCKIVERFRKSGKKGLIVIAICDHDPEGFDVPQALKKYLEIDHGVKADFIRAAITTDQIRKYNLPPCTDAKEKSSRFKNYQKQTGMTVAWELDALEPELLIGEIDRICRSCLDIKLFNEAFKREDEADIKLAMLKAAIAKQVPGLMAEIEKAETITNSTR